MLLTSPTTTEEDDVGVRLRWLRQKQGFSLQYAAQKAHMSAAKLSRIETGGVAISMADIRLLLDIFDPSSQDRTSVITAARRVVPPAEQEVSMHFPGPDHHLQQFFLEQEASARSFRSIDAMCIPGLLQIAAYAKAIFEQLGPYMSEKIVADAVRTRLDRQQYLFEQHRDFSFVVSEAALRAQFVPANHLSQLHHLVSLSTLPNVDLKIVPMGEPLHVGSFMVYDERVSFSDDKPSLIIETSHEIDVQNDLDVIEQLSKRALSGSGAVDLLHHLIAELN